MQQLFLIYYMSNRHHKKWLKQNFDSILLHFPANLFHISKCKHNLPGSHSFFLWYWTHNSTACPTSFTFKHIQHTSIFLHLCCQQLSFSLTDIAIAMWLVFLLSLLAPHNPLSNHSGTKVTYMKIAREYI